MIVALELMATTGGVGNRRLAPAVYGSPSCASDESHRRLDPESRWLVQERGPLRHPWDPLLWRLQAAAGSACSRIGSGDRPGAAAGRGLDEEGVPGGRAA